MRPGGYTREEQKALLLRYDALREQGVSHEEACLALGVSPATMKSWKRIEDDIFSVPGPWQFAHRGKSWRDMPGADTFGRRCNFALFRRGLLRLEEPRKRGRPSKKASLARAAMREDGGAFDIEAFRERSD